MTDKKIPIPTSVALHLRHIEWMNDNVHSRSAFVRSLIDEKIDESEGHGKQIEELRKKRKDMLDEIESIEDKIDELKRKQDIKEREEADRVSRMEERFESP